MSSESFRERLKMVIDDFCAAALYFVHSRKAYTPQCVEKVKGREAFLGLGPCMFFQIHNCCYYIFVSAKDAVLVVLKDKISVHGDGFGLVETMS